MNGIRARLERLEQAGRPPKAAGVYGMTDAELLAAAGWDAPGESPDEWLMGVARGRTPHAGPRLTEGQ